MIEFDEAYLCERLRGLIGEYAARFGQGPPMMQMPGGILDQAALMQLAIDRGEPIRDDEIYWPEPGALI